MSYFKTSMIAGMFAVATAFSGAASANVIGVKTITITQSSGFDTSNQYLQIAEVVATQAGTGLDVALATNGATAFASSYYDNYAVAAKAIDGGVAAAFPEIFHSGFGANQMLTITLSGNFDLSGLSVYGRTDCCSNRDVYDVRFYDASNTLLFTQMGASANNGEHLAAIDVPEPGSLALMAGALLAAGALRRKKM